MLIVGLTGGIATGKSTVSKFLSERHHLPVIDADILARKAVEPGTAAFRRILHTFGDDLAVRDEQGNVTGFDRAALGRRVFNGNEVARKKLNRIVHPAVRLLMLRAIVWEWLVNGAKVIVLDIPLLFENGFYRFCGLTVVVAADNKSQLEWLLARDARLNEEDARGRIASQWDIDHKRKLADVVIENDQSLEVLERRVSRVVKENFERSNWWTWLLRIPPIGLAFALFIFIRRSFARKRKEKMT